MRTEKTKKIVSEKLNDAERPRRPGRAQHVAAHNRPRRKRRLEEMYRNLDDPWYGEETLLGLKVWTEEELAQHATVSVEVVRMWIRAGLPVLPGSADAVRISEAAFDEWAKNLGRPNSTRQQSRSVVAAPTCSTAEQSTGERNEHGPGRPGRKIVTLEIARFIESLNPKKTSWKKILKLCQERWPNDARVQRSEQLRGTYRRHRNNLGHNSD